MFRALLTLTALLGSLVAANAESPLGDTRQLIVVVSNGSDVNQGTLATFEREVSSKWHRLSAQIPVTLGRNGMAWGIGRHSNAPLKREGDGRSPEGVFELEKIYGSSAQPTGDLFSYAQLSDASEGVDDPRSRSYNRIVDASAIRARDWHSSERLRPTNPMFRWIVNVKHNWQQQPGFGSCIYLHIWKAPGSPTSGCTAMSPASLERIVRWLDQRKQPLLVQLTREDYARYREPWNLP